MTIASSTSVWTGRGQETAAQQKTPARAKGHTYTIEQETYIAQLLSDPEIWSFLDGPGEANDFFKSKIDVHKELAKKVNAAFSTIENPVQLNATQLKNKIEHMKRLWKKANGASSTGKRYLSNGFLTLEPRIKGICHYYYILEDLCSQSFFLNPRNPSQLVSHLECQDDMRDYGDEASFESTDEDDFAVEHVPAPLAPFASSASSAPSLTGNRPAGPSTTSKRGRDTDVLSTLQELLSTISEKQELKRKKLSLQERNIAIQERNIMLQERLVEAQIRKIDIEVRKKEAKIEEIEQQKLLYEVEIKRLDVQKIFQQGELERARALPTNCRFSGFHSA
ncbi:hypothetical protein BGZ65_001348 [Modicella reniformis]|uniref:Uncharacterized protein n=1 Tax=Modicella reniformis TaxID=1440133 RepID=A0A9P6MJ73_9FUNG|nr:hypothetical protein BGZ65_001348 [Modicella reniformis]